MARTALLALLLIGGCSCEGGDGLDNIAPNLVITPLAIDFGDVTVGDLRVRALTLENTGGLAVDLTRVTLTTPSGELAIVTAAPAGIGPNAKIELALSFNPRDLGPEDGTITIEASDGKPARVVTLHGVGVSGGVAVTPNGDPCEGVTGSLAFGDAAIGQRVEKSITVRNDGTGSYSLTGVELEGSAEFAVQMVPTGTLLESSASYDIVVTYTPADGGRDVGTVVIDTDAADQPTVRVPVCGQGIAAALCARPLPLDFGVVGLGTSQTMALHLESCGLLPLEITGARLSADAAHPTNPNYSMPVLSARTLMPGEMVDVMVTFQATVAGRADGFVEINSTGGDTFVPITALAAVGCDLTVAPSTLSYAGVAAGASQTKSVVVVNGGASTCNVSRIAITAGAPPFALRTPPALPLVIPAGGTTLLEVTYAPTVAANHTGTLEIEESGVITPVSLIGNIAPPSGCEIDVRPPALSHGIVALGADRDLAVELVNVSRSICLLRGASITTGSSEFSLVNAPAIATIRTGSPLVLTVRYRPTAIGPTQGVLRIRSNDAVNPSVDVPLFGSAARPGICVEPQRLAFGTLPVGSQALRDFRVTACGGTSVEVASMTFPAGPNEFRLVNRPALPFTLAAGASQTVTMAYAPIDVGVDSTILTLATTNANDPTVDVIATGEGVIPATDAVYLHTPSDLFAFDPVTSATRQIGSFPLLVAMTDIAIDLSGAMYGVDADGTIWRINPTNAALTRLFSTPSAAVGLTCLSDGKLVVAGASLELWDPSTQSLDRVIVPAGQYSTSGDVIALPDGFLYWSVEAGADYLVRVDPANGMTQRLAPLGIPNIWGLGYANMKLFAFAQGGVAAEVDPSSGASSNTRPVPGEWLGATTNPVLW